MFWLSKTRYAIFDCSICASHSICSYGTRKGRCRMAYRPCIHANLFAIHDTKCQFIHPKDEIHDAKHQFMLSLITIHSTFKISSLSVSSLVSSLVIVSGIRPTITLSQRGIFMVCSTLS